MNKLLTFFGLVKIKRVKCLTKLLHLYFNQCVINGVKEDFNVLPINNPQKTAEKWWNEEFDRILKYNANDVTITTKSIFKRA